MRYESIGQPFRSRELNDGEFVVISDSGDHIFLSSTEHEMLKSNPARISLELSAALRARFMLASAGPQNGISRLLESRIRARNITVSSGVSLHIIVPTLQCAHSCRYCQVSRSLTDIGHTISNEALILACESIFQSPVKNLTVEFQGGDPLVRFDLIQFAIDHIEKLNVSAARNIRFVVASTLHQLTTQMCEYFKKHDVFLSTSLDGPKDLHNKNRPTPGRDSYERTISGIGLARQHLGFDFVSALMTTTKASLHEPEAIVDEYVRLGFSDIFLRQLSLYGFAKKNQNFQGYSLEEFNVFYKRAFDRILEWNRRGTVLREVNASVILNKILSPFDAGYVDLQSPSGAGRGVLVYNYDGFIYPSDEARMLAEAGDKSLRLGPIGTSAAQFRTSELNKNLERAGTVANNDSCKPCAYNVYCAPNPVDSLAQHGDLNTPPEVTNHCNKQKWLFDFFFEQIQTKDQWYLDLMYSWSNAGSKRVRQ